MSTIQITVEVLEEEEEFMDDDEFVEMFARCWSRYFGDPISQINKLSIWEEK